MATTTKKRAKTRAKKPAAKGTPKKAPSKAQAPKAKEPAGRPAGSGSFCWNELLTKDVPGARAFYGALFGWKPQEMDMGPGGIYTLWMRGKDGVGGCMAMPSELAASGTPPHWVSYVEVADVDASARRAASLGARICHGPADIPGIGRFAVLTDPQGADFCVFRPAPMS